MLVSTENKVVSFYAQIHDINQPERGFGYHVDYVTVKTYSDGEKVTSGPFQCNAAKAVELGLDLGAAMATLNLAAQAAVDIAHVEISQKEQQIEQITAERNDALQAVQAMAKVNETAKPENV